ncbi:MAG: septal ring lytic transglycosylase RlpA family protein [Agarilytica sp.]
MKCVRLLILVSSIAFSACSTMYVAEEKDSGPARPLDVSHIQEPVPRHEIRTKAGNSSPYKVLGKTYRVMQDPRGYKARGVASWYGKKFHGRRTANGELYDMYGMTAAHKTLPIPSYVRVTNLNNYRSVIVRVNDRGPFHGDRVIDLTYTAAKKLGFENSGTAKVSLEYLDPDKFQAKSTYPAEQKRAGNEPAAPSPKNSAGYALPENTYLQVGAFGRQDSAQAFKQKLAGLTSLGISIVPSKKRPEIYKVQVGPFKDNLQVLQLRQRLQEANYPDPHVVYR